MQENKPFEIADFTRYEIAPALWVITVYYNPCGYKSRRSTYDAFVQTMRDSGINVLTVECAFGDDPFELPPLHDVIKIRSNSLLWQKERLINIGASYLPESCKYVAWVDCDVVFENQNWARETCELLSDSCTVVQLFESCTLLEKGDILAENPRQFVSFGKITNEDKSTIDCGRYDKHGHPGFAWAMRREIFDAVGLYEHAVSGGADHYMAHAAYGCYGFCVYSTLGNNPIQIDHLKRWGDTFYGFTQGKLGAVSGNIYHLWHGNRDRRDYFNRIRKITEYRFNPDMDLLAMPGRPLEWQSHALEIKPDLIAYFAEYFEARQEDTE